MIRLFVNLFGHSTAENTNEHVYLQWRGRTGGWRGLDKAPIVEVQRVGERQREKDLSLDQLVQSENKMTMTQHSEDKERAAIS